MLFTATTLFGTYYSGANSIIAALGLATTASAMLGPIGIFVAISASVVIGLFFTYKCYQTYKSLDATQKHQGYETANAIALASPDTLIVSIADREGDMYDLLQKMPSESNKAYWLGRSSHNREVLNEKDNETDNELALRLREAVRASKPIGRIEFKMSPGKIHTQDAWTRRERKERIVHQEIRGCTVYVKPPSSKYKINIYKKSAPIPINVVHCREINAPSDEETIEWFLLTSFPVNDAETAIEVVKWYLCRWQIELFFKILKSGCAVEELQFKTLKATMNCISIYLIVAWRILYLTMLGRNCPDMDCSAVFEASEWQSVPLSLKNPPPRFLPN